MERANDAILLADPRGVILEMNRRGEELLGLPAAEAVGRSYEEFVPEEELTLERSQQGKILAEGQARRDNARVRRVDGQLGWVDYSASVVELAGERVVLVIVHEATARKR